MRLPTLSQTLVILLYQVAEDEDDEERVCWGGGNLHQLKVSTSATKWEKVGHCFFNSEKIYYLPFSGRFSGRGWPWDQTLWTAGWICLCFCVVLRFSTSLCAFFSWTGLRCGDCSWQEQRGDRWWRWRWRRTWPSWGRSTRAVLIWACRIGMSESTGGGNASPVHPFN